MIYKIVALCIVAILIVVNYAAFVAHKHMASEATTVEELIKEMKQIAEDTALIKKTAVANDLKAMRKTAKAIKEINK